MISLSINNKIKASSGKLLLAEPFLQDKYFSRSVVLLCHHDFELTYGLVLNNYIEIDLTKFSSKMPKIDSRICIGGSLEEQRLFYIHRSPNVISKSTEVYNGIYIGGKFKDLKEGIENGLIKQKDIRFFLGYSSWEYKQFNDEIEEKSWLVTNNSNVDIIFDTKINNLWKKLMKQNKEHSHMAEFPTAPDLN